MDRPFAATAVFLAVLLAAFWLPSPLVAAATSPAEAAGQVTDDSPEPRASAPTPEVLERQPPDLLLVPNHDPRNRSQALELIARQADSHAQYAFQLAAREAFFSAEAEFAMALRLVAQGLDAEYHTKAHSRTLAAGLTALAEVEDFCPRGSDVEADLDLPRIVRAHRTPALHDAPCDNLSALDAIQSYLTFAQEQLSFSAGGEVAGSMALYGLGKLHETLSEKATAGTARPKAIVFFQASLLVSPRNYMASNDLGVVLARSGRHEDARAALEHSVSIRAEASGWHNLAVVYRQLGMAEAAQRATRLAEAGRPVRPLESKLPPGAVAWVDPSTFARAAGQPLLSQSAPRSAAPAAPSTPPKQAASWLPWKMPDARK